MTIVGIDKTCLTLGSGISGKTLLVTERVLVSLGMQLFLLLVESEELDRLDVSDDCFLNAQVLGGDSLTSAPEKSLEQYSGIYSKRSGSSRLR